MAKTVTLRIEDDVYEVFKAAAQADHRSIANLLETAALRHLEHAAFTDDEETSEIVGNRTLMKRLKTAHTQAVKRRGTFVRGL